MSKRHNKDTTLEWKTKAISRRKENASLKKRLQEVIQSRDSWKRKCISSKSNVSNSIKAKNHCYDLSTVLLVTELYKYGSMSLRSCCHVLKTFSVFSNLSPRIPCHNSIKNWICKLGFYRLRNAVSVADEYVLIVDESITFGSEKILLILGIKKDQLPTNRSLTHDDMEVLGIEVGKEWKAAQVVEVIKNLDIKVVYVVSDQGNNLRKAYKSLEYTHIEDCTHIFANYLKNIYASSEKFEEFRKEIGRLRQKWNLSKNNSQYMPPGLRIKMRFANLFPCVNWAEKMLKNWAVLPSEVQMELSFLEKNTAFIIGLIQVGKYFKTICKQLKTAGFQSSKRSEIEQLLKEIEEQKWGHGQEGLTDEAITFLDNIRSYLVSLDDKSQILEEDFLFCSSDIIESYFGKFKAKKNTNSKSALTEFVFSIATFGKKGTTQEVKEALEGVKCKELKLQKKMSEVA